MSTFKILGFVSQKKIIRFVFSINRKINAKNIYKKEKKIIKYSVCILIKVILTFSYILNNIVNIGKRNYECFSKL